MQIRELTTIDEMLAAFEVLQHMYPKMTREKYGTIIRQRKEEGYRMVGVFDGNKCVSSAGFWIGVRFYCGKFIQLDNMVTLPEYRSKGAGKIITDFIKEIGKTENCLKVLVDTYVENFDAHRFFLKEGFIIRGYHLNYTI